MMYLGKVKLRKLLEKRVACSETVDLTDILAIFTAIAVYFCW